MADGRARCGLTAVPQKQDIRDCRGGRTTEISGGDAPGGNTRTHPEHAACIYAGMLSPGRPMILYWRRYGKAGGCRIKKEEKKIEIEVGAGTHRINSCVCALTQLTGAYSSAG